MILSPQKNAFFYSIFLFSISVLHSRPTPPKLGSSIAHVEHTYVLLFHLGIGRNEDIAPSWRFRQNIKRGRTARVASVLRAALTISSLWLEGPVQGAPSPTGRARSAIAVRDGSAACVTSAVLRATKRRPATECAREISASPGTECAVSETRKTPHCATIQHAHELTSCASTSAGTKL